MKPTILKDGTAAISKIQVTHVTRPEAAKAIVAAAIYRGMPPNTVTRLLNEAGVNRQLFILASVLQAAEAGMKVGHGR